MHQPVEGITVDLYKYYETTFVFRYVDYHIHTEYVNPHAYKIWMRRLDGPDEYPDTLQLLVWDTYAQESSVVDVLPSHVTPQGVCIPMTSSRTLIPLDTKYMENAPRTTWPPLPLDYRAFNSSSLSQISREAFNARFDTDIVGLPTSMFAIGYERREVERSEVERSEVERREVAFIYHEGQGTASVEFKNIREPVDHLLSVVRRCQLLPLPIYFILSSTDGFPENAPWSPGRERGHILDVDTCSGTYLPPGSLLDRGDSYPVFHKHRWILAQSAHTDYPYALTIPDRHYFFHNLYHSFRSFHQGIAWSSKIPKIVYGGQARDTPYNFMEAAMRENGVAPRHFFKEIVAPQYPDIIVCDPDRWIDRRDMVAYKYILDIDGAASTWDATAWKLNSGSVILKPRSVWKQWFYDRYVAGVHYIELANDFSDIADKFAWCEAHPQECQRMIDRCLALFQDVYRYHNVMADTVRILHTLGQAPAPSVLHTYLDGVIYINLDKRPDRRHQFESQCFHYGISCERFSAIPHAFGIVGCTRSHQAVYRLAKERGWRRVLIFEDDFEFLVSREAFEETVRRIVNVPDLRWDVCMLAYHLIESEPCSECDQLLRVRSAQTASAYLVESHYYDTLIELYDHAIPLLESTEQHWNYANDQAWKALQAVDRWYCTRERQGKQRDGFSDNAQEFVTYNC